MAQKVPIGKRKGNIKNTSVIPRLVTPVTGRGNPFLFLDSSIFPRGVKENGLPRRFAPRNDRVTWDGAPIYHRKHVAAFLGRHRGRPLRA